MRKTYAEINLKNINFNIRKILKKYNTYKYYFAVIKANSYGFGAKETLNEVIDAGCNYIAVATIEEAIKLRKYNKEIPILCLGIIFKEDIQKSIKNNITITISSLNQVKDILKHNCSNLKVHIKLNTGMNRLGIKNENELIEVLTMLKNNNIEIEGIYTHIYDANNKSSYENQLQIFNNIIKKHNLEKIKIIHIAASDTIINYKKPEIVNGCRLGIIMYGFLKNLKSTITLKSEIIQINDLNKNEIVGYNGIYKSTSKNTKIGVIPIGYADGINRHITGNYIYINNKKYSIVGNICMDMLFVEIDDYVNIHDTVYIYKDTNHIKEISKSLNTIPYELICNISPRVKRIYIK